MADGSLCTGNALSGTALIRTPQDLIVEGVRYSGAIDTVRQFQERTR